MSELVSTNLLVIGFKTTQFDGLWDVTLGLNDGAFEPGDGPGASLDAGVRVQVDIIRAATVIDTLTETTVWTYDPLTRMPSLLNELANAQSSSLVGLLSTVTAMVANVLNGVYTGDPP